MYYFIDPNAKGDERDLGSCPFETGVQKVYWMMGRLHNRSATTGETQHSLNHAGLSTFFLSIRDDPNRFRPGARPLVLL
jgi:hypothetical protein